MSFIFRLKCLIEFPGEEVIIIVILDQIILLERVFSCVVSAVVVPFPYIFIALASVLMKTGYWDQMQWFIH